MHESRRQFLKSGGAVLGAAATSSLLSLPAAAARTSDAPLQWLTAAEAVTLECVAEALVPGATDAGICRFIDSQLAAPAAENQLMLQYLGVAHGDHAVFYRTALAEIDRLSAARFERPCQRLTADERQIMLAMIAGDEAPDWQGAPASFVFFVLRSDAVDVVYGTETGFQRLELPHMAHIAPETPW